MASAWGSLAPPSWVDEDNPQVAAQAAADVAAARQKKAVIKPKAKPPFPGIESAFGSLAPKEREP